MTGALAQLLRMRRMKQDLSGKTALVTGASAGIGRATAARLAQEGARVLLGARRLEPIQELARELENAEAFELDVRDFAALEGIAQREPIDILVANAGMALGTETLADGDPGDWSTVIDTNIKGVLHSVRALLPGMLERGAGDVVLLGSVAGRQVYPGGNVYNATKHAVRALYEALRLDCFGKPIRFTTVDPGMVETEFSVVRFRGDEGAAAKVYDGMTPLTPADVADAIAYALTRPAHVNIGEIVLWPADQASTTLVKRS